MPPRDIGGILLPESMEVNREMGFVRKAEQRLRMSDKRVNAWTAVLCGSLPAEICAHVEIRLLWTFFGGLLGRERDDNGGKAAPGVWVLGFARVLSGKSVRERAFSVQAVGAVPGSLQLELASSPLLI